MQSSDDEKRQGMQEPDGEKAEGKSMEKLKAKLAKMSTESTLYREQANNFHLQMISYYLIPR